MLYVYHTFISEPLYNGLIFLIGLLPFFDVGVVVIIFTIIVKIILLPLSLKASKSQLEMRGTEKDLAVIKEKYKDNREEQGRKILEYYKGKGINPFASFLILLIQLPILIALYGIFLHSGLPTINTDILYSFISKPSNIDMVFLDLLPVAGKSVLLAIVAGLTTFFQVKLSTPTPSEIAGQSDLAKAMSVQMKYVLPLVMAFIAYTISSAIALYLITSNIFAIIQEFYIKKKYHASVTVV